MTIDVVQGEIWLARLDPVRGREQRGTRPVVVVSGNSMNTHFGIVIACPLSSKVKGYAGTVLLAADKAHGLSEPSEVLTFQIRAISRERLVRRVGRVSNEELLDIKKEIGIVLTY